MLLYSDPAFFQVLEDKEREVHQLLARVARGPRNYRLRILAEGPTDECLFTEWPMNFTSVVTPGLDFLASYIGARNYRFLQPRAFGLAPELLGLLQGVMDEYPMWPHLFELSRTAVALGEEAQTDPSE